MLSTAARWRPELNCPVTQEAGLVTTAERSSEKMDQAAADDEADHAADYALRCRGKRRLVAAVGALGDPPVEVADEDDCLGKGTARHELILRRLEPVKPIDVRLHLHALKLDEPIAVLL